MAENERRDFSTYITDDRILQGLGDFRKYGFRSRNAYINHLLGVALDAYKVETWVFSKSEIESLSKKEQIKVANNDLFIVHGASKGIVVRRDSVICNLFEDGSRGVTQSDINLILSTKCYYKFEDYNITAIKNSLPYSLNNHPIASNIEKYDQWHKVITLCNKFVDFQSNII